MTPIAVTIAGSDSSGGAGIQADLKTFSALGVYGASVITALTAQNTKGVRAIHDVPAEFVGAQIDAVFSDLDVSAVKIGMVSQRGVIETIGAGLERWRDLGRPGQAEPRQIRPGCIEGVQDEDRPRTGQSDDRRRHRVFAGRR